MAGSVMRADARAAEGDALDDAVLIAEIADHRRNARRASHFPHHGSYWAGGIRTGPLKFLTSVQRSADSCSRACGGRDDAAEGGTR